VGVVFVSFIFFIRYRRYLTCYLAAGKHVRADKKYPIFILEGYPGG